MSCKNCQSSHQSGRQPYMPSGVPLTSINNANEKWNPPHDMYDPPYPIRPAFPTMRKPVDRTTLQFYKPMTECRINQNLNPTLGPFAACVSSMPCNDSYMNTVLPNGNTIGYYMARNRVLSNPLNKIPYYDPLDPTVMWSAPNDYSY